MIQGEKIHLRALEDRDAETLRGWRNDPELFRYHFSTLPLSQIGQRRWYENYSESSNTLVFMIETGDERPAGYTLLKNIDRKNRHAEIGLYLDPAFQGKGFGKDAFRTLIQFCFHELNLHRVYLHVVDFNERAISMYEGLGFQTEGRLRQVFFTENAYHDIVVMSVLENEWT